MSSYFGGVSIADSIVEGAVFSQGHGVVQAATYLGVAPEITTVLYAPGDKLGLACAIASLIPIGICVSLLTIFLCRRTVEDLWVGLGQLGCEVLNGVLKLIIKEPRPSSPVTNMPVDSFGMPSAHSQYMGYFAMILLLQSLKARNTSIGHKLIRCVSVLALSIFTAYSRYYLYYHTGRQVSVGYLVGAGLGFVWLESLHALRYLGLVDWGLGLWPCRLMLLKDSEYSVSDEYDNFKKSKALKNKKKE